VNSLIMLSILLLQEWYAGNPEQLSVRAAFPKLYALEEKYGGLCQGNDQRKTGTETARRKSKKIRARLFSFQGWYANLAKRQLAANLGDSVKLDCLVETYHTDAIRQNILPYHVTVFTRMG